MKSQVVVAEDDAGLSYAMQHALRVAGYDVTAYEDAVLAWDAVGPGGKLDLLITDLVFPAGRANGVALSRHAASHHHGTPVIFITGHPEAATFVDEGVRMLMKPFEMEALIAAAGVALAEARLKAYRPVSRGFDAD